MPFPKWSVAPVYLSRRPIPPDKRIADELECTANLTLASALRQLANLVQIADAVFGELQADCALLVERAGRLRRRALQLAAAVEPLDARSVSVPQADLTWFSERKLHFHSPQPLSTNLFSSASRPECVRRLYESAAARRDCHEECEVFWGDERQRRRRRRQNELLDIETRRPAILTPSRQQRSRSAPSGTDRAAANDFAADHDSPQRLSPPPSTVDGATVLGAPERDAAVADAACDVADARDDIGDDAPRHDVVVVLPTPEEQLAALAREFPASVVAIDTSERSFNRMAAMRKSLIHVDFFIRTKARRTKKVKRSNTVCDSSSQTDASAASRRLAREAVATSTVSAPSRLKLSHSSVQTDCAAASAYENGTNGALSTAAAVSSSLTQFKERAKRRSERLSANSLLGPAVGGTASVATADSSGSSQDIPTTLKNDKRISFYEKLKLMGRRREASKERHATSATVTNDPKQPAGKADAGQAVATNNTNIGEEAPQQTTTKCGAPAKLPISSNSQAINVAVKLRESSQRPAEQTGQSSSGNWSGTSSGASTRASDCVERDASPQSVQDAPVGSGGVNGGSDGIHDQSGSSVVAPGTKRSPSESSLEKDSALSDTTQTTDRVPTRFVSPGRLKPMRTGPAAQLQQQQQQRLGLRKVSMCSDDGESSTYSVDTDGYYTSMHTDSGVPQQIPEDPIEGIDTGTCKKGGDTLTAQPVVKIEKTAQGSCKANHMASSGASLVRRGSQGSIDTTSVNSILSACDAQIILDDDDLHDLKTLTLTRAYLNKNTENGPAQQATPLTTKTDKAKPNPPPRTTSVLSQGVPLDSSACPAAENKTADAPTGTNSLSTASTEIDTEDLATKTAINAHRYPSICVVTSSETSESSDDTRSPLDGSQVSSLSPINSCQQQHDGGSALQQHVERSARASHRIAEESVLAAVCVKHDEPSRIPFQIKNAFQPIIVHPTRLASFTIDENANEKQLICKASAYQDLATCPAQMCNNGNFLQPDDSIDFDVSGKLTHNDPLNLEFSSLPPTLQRVSHAQILRLDTDTSHKFTHVKAGNQDGFHLTELFGMNANGTFPQRASNYPMRNRPTSMLTTAQKIADNGCLMDGPASLPLDLHASNGVSLRRNQRQQLSTITSPTRCILSRNSEILSQSSPTDTDSKSLSDSPVDSSPLGVPPPPPALSYHSSILDEGSIREPSVAQSPAKSLEDETNTLAQQHLPTKFSTLSLGRSSRVGDMTNNESVSILSATIPRSFKPADSEIVSGSLRQRHTATYDQCLNKDSGSTISRHVSRGERDLPVMCSSTVFSNRQGSTQRCGSAHVSSELLCCHSVLAGRPTSVSISEHSSGTGSESISGDASMNQFSLTTASSLQHGSSTTMASISSESTLVEHPAVVNATQATHAIVHNPRSRSGIVDLELNLESCYVPPPQLEMPTPPNCPSRPSSFYDDSRVYAAFLPGPHTPVATYVPTKQYLSQPIGNDSSSRKLLSLRENELDKLKSHHDVSIKQPQMDVTQQGNQRYCVLSNDPSLKKDQHNQNHQLRSPLRPFTNTAPSPLGSTHTLPAHGAAASSVCAFPANDLTSLPSLLPSATNSSRSEAAAAPAAPLDKYTPLQNASALKVAASRNEHRINHESNGVGPSAQINLEATVAVTQTYVDHTDYVQDLTYRASYLENITGINNNPHCVGSTNQHLNQASHVASTAAGDAIWKSQIERDLLLWSEVPSKSLPTSCVIDNCLPLESPLPCVSSTNQHVLPAVKSPAIEVHADTKNGPERGCGASQDTLGDVTAATLMASETCVPPETSIALNKASAISLVGDKVTNVGSTGCAVAQPLAADASPISFNLSNGGASFCSQQAQYFKSPLKPHSRDRRSWSVQSETVAHLSPAAEDNHAGQQSDQRRASLASDRLGPCKPTSLTDFKRLLIQTRNQTKPLLATGERRKSAVELLRLGSTPISTTTSTSRISSTTPTAPQTIISQRNISPGTLVDVESLSIHRTCQSPTTVAHLRVLTEANPGDVAPLQAENTLNSSGINPRDLQLRTGTTASNNHANSGCGSFSLKRGGGGPLKLSSMGIEPIQEEGSESAHSSPAKPSLV